MADFCHVKSNGAVILSNRRIIFHGMNILDFLWINRHLTYHFFHITNNAIVNIKFYLHQFKHV